MHPRFRGLQDPWRRADQPDDELGYEPYDEPHRPGLAERLTHLVLVDGRLVDLWHEPVGGTRWAHHADAFDRERRPAPPPAPPLHEQVLTWLSVLCGGPEALSSLNDAPLLDDQPDLPDTRSLRERQHLEVAAEQLDGVVAAFFDEETEVAFRRALVRYWTLDPRIQLRSAAHLAAGVCWTVGRANGLLGPGGRCTQKAVSLRLDLGASGLSCAGQAVQRTLNGVAPVVQRPRQTPDITLLGHPDLLLGDVRHRLVLLRDQALRVRASLESRLP